MARGRRRTTKEQAIVGLLMGAAVGLGIAGLRRGMSAHGLALLGAAAVLLILGGIVSRRFNSQDDHQESN